MHRLLVLACVVIVGCAPTRPPDAPRVHATPASMAAVSESYGYSQAVRVGATVWVSGQVGFGPEGIPAGVDAQARLAFENLRLVLAEAGATLDDVVSLTTYHTSMTDLPGFAAVKGEFIEAPFPAWTAVEVSGLAEPALRVEIQAVAVVGSGR